MLENQATTTLGQAIQRAVAAEHAAARFYETLVQRASDDETRSFFMEMVKEEEQHAMLLEDYGASVPADESTRLSDAAAQRIEVVPGWEYAEGISFEQAIDVAIEAENNAALYYDAMADFTQGEVKTFFQKMASLEEAHAERLRGLVEIRLPS